MGKVTVELFEYALFINHNKGITVIFPERNHVLTVEGPNGTLPVTRGADMEMMGPGGRPFASAPPTELPGYGQFVLDLQAAYGPGKVEPSLFDPSTPVDPACINGRLLLKGGRINGSQCSVPEKRVQYTFPKGPFTVTDTAVFEMDIPDGEVAQLRINTTFIDVEDGTTIRIHNGDGLGCPPKDFWALDELVPLSELGGCRSVKAPTAAGGYVTAQGPTNVCPNARVKV
jgi:hypothetical protein